MAALTVVSYFVSGYIRKGGIKSRFFDGIHNETFRHEVNHVDALNNIRDSLSVKLGVPISEIHVNQFHRM